VRVPLRFRSRCQPVPQRVGIVPARMARGSGPDGRADVHLCTDVRKVGAPQGRVQANGLASRGDGKCHRKEDSSDTTAPAHAEDGRSAEKLKRCGKSAPASW